VVSAHAEEPATLSHLAEPLLGRLRSLSASSMASVTGEALRRPSRWLPSLRRILERGEQEDRRAAAMALGIVGEVDDIRRLRLLGRELRLGGDGPGRSLARRLAPRVMVEDLGRVRVVIGTRVVDGTDVRRKVLALLCFLITKPRFSSTREEVLDALWPELDPASALNSLNQTVYFLRRVFEPGYREDESPGYLRQDAETIWLDAELTDARSRRCWALIDATPRTPEPEAAVRISEQYEGRFALDFAYEEWAATFRDTLHAAYLRVMEQAIRHDLNAGTFDRAIRIAERACVVDPDAEEIQVALIKLYRLAGAFAAAAEQYEHYSAVQRGLGLDAAPFEVVVGGVAPIGTPAY
jgi:DNA-binding SARP family transcriptional activator